MLFINKRTGQQVYIVQYIASEPATLAALAKQFPEYNFRTSITRHECIDYVNTKQFNNEVHYENSIKWRPGNNFTKEKSTSEHTCYFANMYELDREYAVKNNFSNSLICYSYEDLAPMGFELVSFD